MTKRTFIGIKINLETELLEVFDQLKDELCDEKIRWVKEANLHVTLHFFGEIKAEQVEKVKVLMAQTIKQFQTFSIVIRGISCFKKHALPSAVFFNIENAFELEDLAFSLKKGIAELGFQAGKKFKPHLTIGRVKHLNDKQVFYTILEKFNGSGKQIVSVSELIFYESVLKPEGPDYMVIDRFPLG